jgi:phospholipid N-methyltransferase
MSTSPARTLKGSRRLQRRRDRRSPSPQWQFLRGFFKNPVMVGSIIPSSKVLIEKMLAPVDWANTKLFVEYGPGVGTFTRPVLEQLAPDATLVTLDTNPDFTRYLKESIDDPRLVAVTGSAADVE